MNPTVIKQGNAAAAGAFNPAQRDIQAQLPAIANLYNTLLQGLQAQSGAQMQNTAQSAQTRGVGSLGLSEGIAGILAGALNQGQAQLGVDTAASRAGIQSQIGQARASKGKAGIEFASNIQDANLKRAEQQLALQDLDRQFQLDAIREQTRRAQAAASASGPSSELKKTIQGRLTMLAGGDGNVSPKDFGLAMQDWVEAGGSVESFAANFGDFVDTSHIQDYYYTDQQREQANALARTAGGYVRSGVQNTLQRFFGR